jgi:hypothetical protein
MLFLMNDVILDFGLRALIPPEDERRLRHLSYADVLREGARMFQEKHNLPHVDVKAAQRLAAMIVTRAPQANAALFDVPPAGSRLAVKPYVVCVSIELLASLYAEFKVDRLTRDMVDRKVWSRMPRTAAA